MTLPVIAGFNTGTSPIQLTEHSIVLPTGINAGDLLVVVFGYFDAGDEGGDSTIYPDDTISGTGWTLSKEKYDVPLGMVVYSKVATGSDALTLNTAALVFSAHVSYRITGHGSSVTAAFSSTSSVSTNPAPPTCTQSGAAQDTMWIAGCVINSDDIPTAVPSGYINLHSAIAGTNVVTIATVEQGIHSSSSESPGTFTIAPPPVDNMGVTIAIASTPILTKARLTQLTAESLTQMNPNARLTQLTVEVLSSNSSNVGSKSRRYIVTTI